MNAWDPVSERPFGADDPRVVPWADARERLGTGGTYWLMTVRPGRRPHAMPLLAVWANDALHFAASPATRKAKNLAISSDCVMTVASHGLDLVVEAKAVKVCDRARLERVAEAYASKYAWYVDVRDGAFYGEGAPTAGPPPYEVYEVIPSRIFGFGEDESLPPTQWRFGSH